MKKHYLNEIRHLKPRIRLALLQGTQQYHDQEEPIEVEEDSVKKLLQSGQLSHAGGQSMVIDPELLLRDKIKRAPQLAAEE